MIFMNLIIIAAGIIGLIYSSPIEDGIKMMRCSIFETSADLLYDQKWVGNIILF
jgi:hypothetical protein